MTVMRSYMELNRDAFEKISQAAIKEEEKKQYQSKALSTNWEALERKYK